MVSGRGTRSVIRVNTKDNTRPLVRVILVTCVMLGCVACFGDPAANDWRANPVLRDATTKGKLRDVVLSGTLVISSGPLDETYRAALVAGNERFNAQLRTMRLDPATQKQDLAAADEQLRSTLASEPDVCAFTLACAREGAVWTVGRAGRSDLSVIAIRLDSTDYIPIEPPRPDVSMSLQRIRRVDQNCYEKIICLLDLDRTARGYNSVHAENTGSHCSLTFSDLIPDPDRPYPREKAIRYDFDSAVSTAFPVFVEVLNTDNDPATTDETLSVTLGVPAGASSAIPTDIVRTIYRKPGSIHAVATVHVDHATYGKVDMAALTRWPDGTMINDFRWGASPVQYRYDPKVDAAITGKDQAMQQMRVTHGGGLSGSSSGSAGRAKALVGIFALLIGIVVLTRRMRTK